MVQHPKEIFEIKCVEIKCPQILGSLKSTSLISKAWCQRVTPILSQASTGRGSPLLRATGRRKADIAHAKQPPKLKELHLDKMEMMPSLALKAAE